MQSCIADIINKNDRNNVSPNNFCQIAKPMVQLAIDSASLATVPASG